MLIIENEFNYDSYQVVHREFFAHQNEPSATFNNYKFYVNSACLNLFVEADYVQALVNKEKKILALKPCGENDKDSFTLAVTNKGNRKCKHITCKLFFLKIFEMMNWNYELRYKILGKKEEANGEQLIVFDLSSAEVYQRVTVENGNPKATQKPLYPKEWQTQFGLPFCEHKKTVGVNIFNDYVVLGISDEETYVSNTDDENRGVSGE